MKLAALSIAAALSTGPAAAVLQACDPPRNCYSIVSPQGSYAYAGCGDGFGEVRVVARGVTSSGGPFTGYGEWRHVDGVDSYFYAPSGWEITWSSYQTR